MAKEVRDNEETDKKRKNQAQEEPLGLFLKGSALTLFLIGFFIFLYPFVVDSLNNVIDQARLQTYQREVRQKGEEEQKTAKQYGKSKSTATRTRLADWF